MANLRRKTQGKRRARGSRRDPPASRGQATRVLAQGAGAVPRKAFGSIPSSLPSHCWDAFHSSHAALPRAVGPYTVVRTTVLHKTSSVAVAIGTMQRALPSGELAWSSFVMAHSNDPTLPLSTLGSTDLENITPPGSRMGDDSTFTCCPSAISVQVMCPTALQTASGQVTAAVCPVRMSLGDDTRSWNNLNSAMLSFFRPRVMTAGKLALRGVQLDSFPLSMAECSEFLPFRNDAAVSGTFFSSEIKPRGWAPFYITNVDGADLTFLITVEWRVRFDVGNPAAASHTHHGVTSDAAWDHHIRRASAALPGVVDIVSKVADVGVSAVKGAAAVHDALAIAGFV